MFFLRQLMEMRLAVVEQALTNNKALIAEARKEYGRLCDEQAALWEERVELKQALVEGKVSI